LHHQHVLLLLQLGLLILDHIDQQLVLKSLWCHSEVNNGDLYTNLRQIVRVLKFSCDVELEIIAVGHPGISQPYDPLALHLDNVLLQEGFERWV
jgi:hypothetical protein